MNYFQSGNFIVDSVLKLQCHACSVRYVLGDLSMLCSDNSSLTGTGVLFDDYNFIYKKKVTSLR